MSDTQALAPENSDLLATIKAQEQELRYQKVDGDFTHGELSLAFDMVADPENWKNHIDTIVRDNPKVRAAISAATIFFAGSPAEFYPVKVKGYVRVVADGYYVRIGA